MKIYLLAGELSGDKLGGALMAGLQQLQPEIEFRGVGGPLMQAEGLESLFPMDELSVMGIAEVLPKYIQLKRRLNQAAEDCIDWRPDALITIDSPDFSLRLARLIKAAEPKVRTIHYVAPSVWAWRPKRAAKMARHIDHVLALLPFEPPYMEAQGMRCDFVGHPVVTEAIATEEDVQVFRQQEGIGKAPLVMVLPGSRGSEIERLIPIFGETVKMIVDANPDARIVVPAAASATDKIIEGTKNWPGSPIVIDPARSEDANSRKRAAFRAADVALAASGTVSLELAAAGTPMVVAYDMNWMSWQIMSRMAKIDTVTLVNLVAERNIVPEFLGPACKPEAIATALLALVNDKKARAEQHQAMAMTMNELGQGGEAPGLRAARAVLDGMVN